MGPLIWREVTVVLRTISFWIAAAVYVSILALFVLIWGDGLPIAGGGTNWQQFSALQWAILVAVLPWAAARCAPRSIRDLTLFAMATAQAPSRLVLARYVALSACLIGLTLSALPLILVMRRIAAIPVAVVATDLLLPLVGLSTFIAVVTTACTLLSANRLGTWAAATALTVAVGYVMPLSGQTTAIWLLGTLVAAAPLLLTADARLTYLPEDGA